MSFNREALPDPVTFFESEGLKLSGPRSSKWKTTACRFHNGSDSLRVNIQTGGWVCMSCGAKGGDVLAYLMQSHGLEFIDAAKQIGAWVDDDKPQKPHRPAALPPRAALEALGFEATFTAICAGNLAQGVQLSEVDRARLMLCAGRISKIAEDYA